MEPRVGPHAAPTPVSRWVPMQLSPPTYCMVGPQGAPSTSDTGNPTAAHCTYCTMGPTTVPSTHCMADPLASSSSRVTVASHAVPSTRSLHGWSPHTSLMRGIACTPHPHVMACPSAVPPPVTWWILLHPPPPRGAPAAPTPMTPCEPYSTFTHRTMCPPQQPPLRVPDGPAHHAPLMSPWMPVHPCSPLVSR